MQKGCTSGIFLCNIELTEAIFETIKKTGQVQVTSILDIYLYNYLSLYEAVAQLVEQGNS